MRYLLLDLETTGLDIDTTKIIQCAYKIVDGEKEKMIDNYYNNEGQRIGVGARAAHGLREDGLEKEPIFRESEQYKQLKQLEDKCIWITHNGTPFDLKILAREGIVPKHHIDTIKIARNHLWEEQDDFEGSYKLNYLRYYLEDKLGVRIEGQAHDAETDVRMLEQLFLYLVVRIKEKYNYTEDKQALIQMVDESTKPAFIAYMPFSKHKGKLMTELDDGFLKWLLGIDLDEDLRYNVEKVIAERKHATNGHAVQLSNLPSGNVMAVDKQQAIQAPVISSNVITDVNPEEFVFDK